MFGYLIVLIWAVFQKRPLTLFGDILKVILRQVPDWKTYAFRHGVRWMHKTKTDPELV
jgi:hypothetical protein